MNGRTIRTPERGERLFARLRLGYSIRAACRAERIGRRTYYEWRDADAEFAKAADAAIEEGTDFLEDKARERAVKQSDLLIMFLLKARRPEKYREAQTVTHDGAVTILVKYDDDHPDAAKTAPGPVPGSS